MERFQQSEIVGYYHICSDGNYSLVLFQDEEDFKAAMNRVAVCVLKTGIIIIAFVLMDNHFHFEVKACSSEQCTSFINEFKRLTGQYNQRKYGDRNSLDSLPIQIIPLTTEDYVRTLLCYIIKNPTKARVEMFYDYRWGTGNLYFRTERQKREYITAGSLGVNQCRRIFKTRTRIPDNWRIVDEVITPENYVPVEDVQQLFKTTRSFMYFLSLNKDDEIEQGMGEWHEISLKDSELRSIRNELSLELFGIGKIHSLSAPQRHKLAKIIRRQYLCSKKQIARIVQLPYDQLSDL